MKRKWENGNEKEEGGRGSFILFAPRLAGEKEKGGGGGGEGAKGDGEGKKNAFPGAGTGSGALFKRQTNELTGREKILQQRQKGALFSRGMMGSTLLLACAARG